MCGFVGFIDKKNKKDKEVIVKQMADKIIHRGPDSDGYYVDDKIALGFRRLSIIDLKEGSQPMYNEDNTVVVTFNGEIYNYQEIKEDLIKKGHHFKTNCDTEVLVHGYEEYNTDLFNKLRGMFSFAIYDIKNEELYGVRDFFGIKPFYYYNDSKLFMIGSEIKSFLVHPDFKKQINEDALKPYLTFQYSVLEETFFKNVFRLKPGHYFKYKNNKLEIVNYFKIKYDKKDLSYDEYKEIIKNELEESVKYHQISDVEVGSYLSGGVDSSYVVSVAKPNKTFSVGFEQSGFVDETTYAKELSNLLNVKNYSSHISSDDFFNILPTVQYHADEPHANLSMVPLYFLSKLASKYVKVVLSGEGSDEMFGGYNEYNEGGMAKVYASLPLTIRKGLANIVTKIPKFKGKNTILYYAKPIEERYVGHAFIMDEEETNILLKDKYQKGPSYINLLKNYYNDVKDEDEVTKKMYIDMNFWLPNDILLKADKMSMANSLELRVPFLDKEIWKISSNIPSKYLIKDNKTKCAFRDVASEVIPEEYAKRRKLGFPVPFSLWAKEDKYYKMIKKIFNEKWVNNFFNVDKINQLLEDHYHNIKNNGRKIYTIYVFLIWYQEYFIKI